MSAPTRRAMVATALAEVATGGASPLPTPDHPDAKLLAACTEFEAAQRAYNGLWVWRLGDRVSVKGPNYIVDDDERLRVSKPIDQQAWDISLRIFDIPAHTIEGLRAKARCLLLADVGMRHLAVHDQECGETRDLILGALTSNLLGTLLQDLNAGAVMPATCMDAPSIEVLS